MSSCKFRKAAGTWWNRCSASTHIQQGREDRTLIKAIVMLLLHFLTMQQISIHWSNQRVQWGEICCQLIVVLRGIIYTHCHYSFQFPNASNPLLSKLARRLQSLQVTNNVGNVSRQHQQHITPLLPINLIKAVLLNFSSHKRPHQPVNFRRILFLLLLDTATILHRQHQETSAIKLLLLQHLRNHKSKSIHKPALPLNPFRHRFLLLQARSEKFWNFVATTKKSRWPIRTNFTTGVRTYFCKSTECPESWSSIAAAIAQVGFLSRRRQSKLCTSSAHFLVIRSRIYGHQVAMIPLRSWRFFVVPQTRFFLFHPTLPASPSFRASKARLEI